MHLHAIVDSISLAYFANWTIGYGRYRYIYHVVACGCYL